MCVYQTEKKAEIDNNITHLHNIKYVVVIYDYNN